MIRTIVADGTAEVSLLQEMRGRAGEIDAKVTRAVMEILESVRREGDAAVLRYTRKFDCAGLDALEVPPAALREAYERSDERFVQAMLCAKDNITAFHGRQKQQGFIDMQQSGVLLGQRIRGLHRVGLYVPGGTAAYPSSVLMNAIPARIAGVEEIVMVTPPPKNGDFNADVMAAAYIAGVDAVYLCGGAQAVAALAYDSRAVTRGDCFFATRGTQSDGHDFIPAAAAAGAAVVVCESLPGELPEGPTYVVVEDTNAAMADMAAAFYDHPSRELHLVGVTGTNGKTTVTTLITLLYDLFRRLGYEAGLISTVVYRVGERRIASTHTTPDVIRLNALMREMVDAGCAYCFMEVSSHAIVQERIRGLHFEGGIFTNITHDHLDYHKTFAAYIEAKKLFFDRLPAGAFALTNADDRNGRVMVQNTRARVAAYSLRSAADFTGRVLEQHLDGMLLRLGGDEVWVGFLGRFNASNLLAVYGAALLLGADRSEVLTAMSCLRPVSGRLEFVRAADGRTAVVDYAHTPDALENVLRTLGELLTGGGQLIAVCGCGGDRDRTKRPEMAAMAVKYAATAIFTSDNPRHEDPESILDEMVAGLPPEARYLRIADRGEAIRAAAMLARPGDIVLLAGKGHETYQIVGDERRHFDDRQQIEHQFSIHR